jgi:hypothetical protein
MQMKKLFGLLLIGFVCLQACKEKVEGPITLKLDLKKGDEFTVVSVMDAKASIMSFYSATEMKVTVDNVVDDKNFECTGDVISMKVKTNMGGEIEDYNSTKNVDEMTEGELEMHEEVKKALNTNVNFTINSSGAVVKKMAYANGDNLGDAEDPLDLSNFLIAFPDKPVNVGDTWTGEKLNPITNTKSVMTYKIEKITAKEIIIDVDTKIDAPVSMMQDSNAKGKYILDRNTGRLLSYRTEMPLQGMMGSGGGTAVYSITAK